MRLILAFSTIAGGIVIGLPVSIVLARGRRADKLRRRGVKSYNRRLQSTPVVTTSGAQ